MRSLSWQFLPAGLLLLSMGCAYTMEGSRQTIQVHCQPPGDVTAVVNGRATDFQTGTLDLSKKRDTHFVTFSKPGHYSSTVSFNREVNPFWVAANCVWGPALPIGLLIDFQTGCIYRLEPRDLYVVLREKTEEEDPKP